MRLYIDTGAPLDARTAGRMLERVGNAYSQYSRRIGITGLLTVDEVRVGSLLVFLRDIADVTTAALTLYEHREILGGFVNHLNDAATAIRQLSGHQVPSATRTAVQALAAPVVGNTARQVRLNVVGDNNRIFIIDRADDELVRAIVEQQRAPRPVPDDGIFHAGDSLAVDRRHGAFRDPALAQTVSAMIQEQQDDAERALRRSSSHLGGIGQTRGTLLNVQGQWYVRPEGLGGLLLPTQSPNDLDLDLEKVGLVEGRIIRNEGNPTGFVIRSASLRPE